MKPYRGRAQGPEATRLRALVPLAMFMITIWAGCSPSDGARSENPPVEEAALADSTEYAEVLAAAQAVLDAINGADPDLLGSVMMPEATIVAVRPDRPPSRSTVEEMAAGIADPPQRFVERMWDPEVRIQHPIASVWAPYDFYRDGEFSHCGVDTFQLVHVDGAWRVESLLYNTLQPPACEPHPDGPPAA